MTISSGLCRLFAISDPPFPNYNGGPTLWGRTTRTVANGTKLGRKKITNPKMTAQIISLRNENKSIRAIASVVGVSTATVQRELKKAA